MPISTFKLREYVLNIVTTIIGDHIHLYEHRESLSEQCRFFLNQHSISKSLLIDIIIIIINCNSKRCCFIFNQLLEISDAELFLLLNPVGYLWWKWRRPGLMKYQDKSSTLVALVSKTTLTIQVWIIYFICIFGIRNTKGINLYSQNRICFYLVLYSYCIIIIVNVLYKYVSNYVSK